MSVTVANLITDHDRYVGDASTDRITQQNRFDFATEAVAWCQEELGNELQDVTHKFDYFDTQNYYKLTTSLADLLEGGDLRRGESDQTKSFSHKSPRELAELIGNASSERAWAIERKDGDIYLVINSAAKYAHKPVASFDTLTADGGTWTADATNGDALNLSADSIEYKRGTGSLKFDIDVSQSGNNKAEVYSTITSIDLDDHENNGSFLMDVYFPDSTNMTSVTLYWGNDNATYWSVSATTDINGNAFVDGWNRLKFDWGSATETGTVDNTAIDYIQVDINYDAGQTDEQSFRLDGLMFVRPEELTFHYTSWYVGTNNSGTNITTFSATTDIPFFSGRYDQYRYPVAHKMASLAFESLRLHDDALREESRAIRAMDRYKSIFQSNVSKPQKTFKVFGVNFNRRRR